MSTPSGHSHRARAALARMPEVDPAIAALALWCQHRDGAEGGTKTAGDIIFYGASFPTLPPQEQSGLLAHHVLHVALRHSQRRSAMAARQGSDFTPYLFDLACDAVINEALLSGGHALPRPAVRAGDLLKIFGRADDQATALLSKWNAERLYHLLCTGNQVGGGDGRKGAAEDYARAAGFEPDLSSDAAMATDEEDGAAIWAQRVEQALQTGRAAGSGLGAAIAAFADLPDPKAPWENRLRGLLMKAVTEQPARSYRRPANRWIASEADARARNAPTPAFEAGYTRTGLRPRIVVGIDTSSSVTTRDLKQAVAEALSIARRTGAEVHALTFDETVDQHIRLERWTQLDNMRTRRDGGTSFEAVIEDAARLAPSILLLMTDADGPYGSPPSFPVIWVVPAPLAAPPPFGTVLVAE